MLIKEGNTVYCVEDKSQIEELKAFREVMRKAAKEAKATPTIEDIEVEVPKKKGRRAVYTKEEIRAHRTAYMASKTWDCVCCQQTYGMGGKWGHLRTNKHKINSGRFVNANPQMTWTEYCTQTHQYLT